jgi:hypothetical protein
MSIALHRPLTPGQFLAWEAGQSLRHEEQTPPVA